MVGVEVPYEFSGVGGWKVFQDSALLVEDEQREGCWRLTRLQGQLFIKLHEDGIPMALIPLGQDNHLLFKLSGPNEGHLVKYPTHGAYLVIAPDDWRRDESLSGSPPAEPEPVSIPRCRAHFFNLNGTLDDRIAFLTNENKQVVIKRRQLRFELVGSQINDASEHQGPLFGSSPPQVVALDDQAWSNIGTIVVGEEGSGKQRWRTEFRPQSNMKKQDLPREVADRKCGWYFLRFYDTNDNIVESLDFRLVSPLREIKGPATTLIPGEAEHKPIKIQLSHEPGLLVRPSGNILCDIKIETTSDTTTLIIHADPACDETRWYVGLEGSPKVEVTIPVERLWWAVSEENKEPSEWKSQVLTVRRDEFSATSNRALWIRLPRRRWMKEVSVGFTQQRVRTYRVKHAERVIPICLRDFCDSPETGTSGISRLGLWIYSESKLTYAGALCELIIELACRYCDFTAPEEKDIISYVKSLHLDELFRPLTYDELRQRISSLPKSIYKCSYCGYYTEADDFLESPTTKIIRHIERECSKAPRRNGPVRVQFTVIRDINQIPKELVEKIPDIVKCEICSDFIEPTATDNKIKHLVKCDLKKLYELR